MMKNRLLLITVFVLGLGSQLSAMEKNSVAKKGAVVEDAALVEVVARFIALPKEKVDAILLEDVTKTLSVEDVAALLKEGQGSVLASPRVITRSGGQAETHGGVMHRFPQDYDVEVVSTSESSQPPGFLVKPQDWRDFNIGSKLKVTPTRSEDGKTISVKVMASLTWELDSDVHSAACRTAGFDISNLELPLPSVSTISCVTSVVMNDGETVIISGGTPNRSGEEVIYILLTCHSL